jgi:hypothetical protein
MHSGFIGFVQDGAEEAIGQNWRRVCRLENFVS